VVQLKFCILLSSSGMFVCLLSSVDIYVFSLPLCGIRALIYCLVLIPVESFIDCS